MICAKLELNQIVKSKDSIKTKLSSGVKLRDKTIYSAPIHFVKLVSLLCGGQFKLNKLRAIIKEKIQCSLLP